LLNKINEKKERAILVGAAAGKTSMRVAKEHLAELERLADTAEAETVERVIQRMPKYNSSTLIGPGKLEEIRQLCDIHKASVVIFDDDLTGSQTKNIEAVLKEVKVIDRSQLILDIFALHARTAESRIMVEIAQMEYTMPRLTNMWTHLCRQVGGIGTRGPGETQLETDKRLVRNRISDLRKKLKKIEKSRVAQASRRNSQFHIGVVGYTNAGKSTLTNNLTNAGVLVEDKLFATLDSTTRKLFLSNTTEVILSDTVGFIRKLPHHLVASFKSTLAVVKQADIVLHVVDGSALSYSDHMEVTTKVLKDLIDESVPHIIVFNKVDQITTEIEAKLSKEFDQALFVSALEDTGILSLKERLLMEAELWSDRQGRQTSSSQEIEIIW
jgi:GTP-binding protein HflX